MKILTALLHTTMNKGGRPPLKQGSTRTKTTVSLTHEQQIQFRRLGGSKWLRQQIEKETK